MTSHSTTRVAKTGFVVVLGPLVGVLLGLCVLLLINPADLPINEVSFVVWAIAAGVVLATLVSCVLASGVWQHGAVLPISRNRRAVLVMLFVTVAIFACGWTAWNWKLLRPYHWHTIESPDGKFSLSFPEIPKASTQYETDAIDGRQYLTNRLTASPAPRIGYAVSWWENPEQKDKPTSELFAHFRDCDAEVFRGKVSTKNLAVSGNPAMDIISVNTEGTVAHNRVVRVGSRIYSLWVIDGSGKFAVDKKNISKFYDSFSLH